MCDVLGTCRLQMMELGFEVEHYEKLYTLVTGKKKSWKELIAVSEMIWQLTRSFFVRETKDFGRHIDFAPHRLCHDPIKNGPNKGHYITEEEVNTLLDEYYSARGWDSNGIPTFDTLSRVGLADVAEDLKDKIKTA